MALLLMQMLQSSQPSQEHKTNMSLATFVLPGSILQTTRPADLIDRLSHAEDATGTLETQLGSQNFAAAAQTAKNVETSCTSCHTQYRDVHRN